jgi:tRNA(Ile)-lysidine synthase
MAGSRKPAAASLAKHVRECLAGYLTRGRRLCLALSGGVDSVVLLDLLDRLRGELGFTLTAIHVNHRLSPHADEWARFCAELTAARGVPLRVETVRVRGRKGRGVEAQAREARYQALLAVPADYVVLAHHLDDQVETVFLNLLRGSGVRGLAGMPMARGGEGPRLLRPLLEVPRAVILDYARARGLQWVEDESNRDPALTRNFLRQEILPRIEARFPAYRQAVLRASRHLAEADSLLDELGFMDLRPHLKDGRLRVAALGDLALSRAKNLLRVFLKAQGAPLPDAVRLDEMLHQLLSASPDARVEILWGGFALRRYRGEAWVEPARSLPAADWVRPWRGENRLELPELDCVLEFEPTVGEGIALTALEGRRVELRLRQGGERLRPDCRRPRRSVKKLLQEAGLPPWLRARLPFLWVEGFLVAIPNLGVECGWQAKAGEPGLALALRPFYTDRD